MATTFVDYTGDGNATKSFSFPSIKEADIKVEVDEVLKTAGNHFNITSYTTTGGGNVVFTSGNIPSSPSQIRIFRDTDVDVAKATFTAGSSLKAGDLNSNQTQILYAAQEEQNQTIQTSKIKDAAVTTAKIKDANVTTAKIADDNVTMAKLGSGALPTDITVASANIVDGTIVNADVNSSAAIEGSKIQASSGSNSGTMSAANFTKLAGIETGATADQTNAEIRAAVEAASDSNVFTDADHSKLNAIEASATADQTASEIKTLLQSDKLTLSEMNTTSLDSRYYTETEAEAKFLRQDSSETIASGVTWSNSDAFVATTAAINARILDLVDDVGGFTAIANQTSFPATNPQGTTGQAAILSIQATTATLTPSGTTVTIANGAGSGNTVTITGVSSAIPSGFGFLVESTSTTHTYTFHRLVPKATEVTTVASNITNIVNAGANVVDINNFADIYQISGSAPTQRADGTSLQEGDLWFDSSNDNLLVYTGSTFSIITPSQSVLDDVAIVSGAITYSEDLGLITDAASTGSSNGSLDIVADVLEDEITFTVTAATGKFIIDSVDKPALTLYKGWTYTFDVSDASNASHPLRFSSGGSAYNTGVTVTGTQGQAGAKVQLVVPESQPTSFAYYCTAHSGMGNTITVKDDPLKTVSDNITKIQTCADDLNESTSEIDTVATNIANVNAVGTNISNVNAVNSNATNINSAVSNASNINSVAGSISNVNSVASNMANVNNFTEKYQIASSDPSTDGGGNSLAAGDLYFNTSANELKVYTGSQWQGGVTATGNFAATTGNTFTGANTYNDNVKAQFGTGTDFAIYHDGSTNTLQSLNSHNIEIKIGSNTVIKAGGAGEAQLLYSGNKKLETTNTGATVTGLMTATTIDGAAGDNLQLDFGTL